MTSWRAPWCFPRGHDLAIGPVAVQIATSALGRTLDEPGVSGAGRGVLLFGLVAALQLWRFVRLNGVRVGGFASKVVFGSPTTASFGYVVALVVAYAAAAQDLWWLTALAAVCGPRLRPERTTGCGPTARSRPGSGRGSRRSGSLWPSCWRSPAWSSSCSQR